MYFNPLSNARSYSPSRLQTLQVPAITAVYELQQAEMPKGKKKQLTGSGLKSNALLSSYKGMTFKEKESKMRVGLKTAFSKAPIQ